MQLPRLNTTKAKMTSLWLNADLFREYSKNLHDLHSGNTTPQTTQEAMISYIFFICQTLHPLNYQPSISHLLNP